MTRAEAIDHLKKDGDPNGDIIILWWGKDSFADYDISDETWAEIVSKSYGYDFDSATEAIEDVVRDTMFGDR